MSRRIQARERMPSCLFTLVFILALFPPISTIAHTYPCSEAFSVITIKRNIRHCKKLNTLGVEFGWSNHNESSIDIFIGARLDSESEVGWLAWGVNPHDRPEMVGTKALIGIKQSNGSLILNTYNIVSNTKLGCQLFPSKIDVEVQNARFEYLNQIQYYTIFATLVLPSVYNTSRLNHVWQVGYAAIDTEPKMHPTTLQNVDSSETIDLHSGRSTHNVEKHRRHLRTVHGILNILGWGMLLPIGVIIARYFKKFPVEYRCWFGFHISFQIAGYILGTTGWAIGLWLGHTSRHYSFRTHRILAILIFTFTTLQMLALRLRPKATDDYRKYWNMYHHFLGYALLALISVNIFQGIDILRPDHTWKWAYIGLLVVLVFIFLALEIYTWIAFIIRKRKRKRETIQPTPQETNSTPSNTSQGPVAKTSHSSTSSSSSSVMAS
uniref:Cytochrome b561 and DOMON domain-containing protein n=1 Tax=Davidia involucrata TaxID=16924 RepID=A0A5B6YST1_DAVIN